MAAGKLPHLQLAGRVGDDDDADVIGEHVDAVVAGHRDRDLKFPRQVDVAVDRLRAARVVGAKPVAGPRFRYRRRLLTSTSE